MSSNLPPGVTTDMIPGNRPEDVAWDKFFEWMTKQVTDIPTEDIPHLKATIKIAMTYWNKKPKLIPGEKK